MYRILEEKNTIEKLESKTFSEMGFREREHLQEWISKNPGVFGEELLIIQKEFSGFNDTNERLDLLALDKQGNIVIIENKLDDSGRNVVWQALKYASYCSSLTKANIKEIFQDYINKIGLQDDAENLLSEFFDNADYEEVRLNFGNTQRMIMVAANFRKEVTSTVLWLLNYNLRIQCFKVSPYTSNNGKYVNFEQIIPVKDVEEYVISMAKKSQNDIEEQEEEKTRHKIRYAFWQEFLKESNKRNDLYKNVSPSKDNWISGGTGITSVGFNTVISRTHARVEVYISRPNRDENKFVFDELVKRKNEIENDFGTKLIWQRMDDKKASRIKCELNGVNYFNEDDWPEMIDFLAKSMNDLFSVFKPMLKDVRMSLLDYLQSSDD